MWASYVGLGQDDAVLGDLGLQRLQPGLEVGQVMPQPDRADAGGRDKDTTIKTDNHNLFQEMRRSHSSLLGRERCQITSRLTQLIPWPR